MAANATARRTAQTAADKTKTGLKVVTDSPDSGRTNPESASGASELEQLEGLYLSGMAITVRPSGARTKVADDAIMKRLEESYQAALNGEFKAFVFIGTSKEFFNGVYNKAFKVFKKSKLDEDGVIVDISAVNHEKSPNKYVQSGDGSDKKIWRTYYVDSVTAVETDDEEGTE